MIDLWHNILWSRYKGGVFSRLHIIMQREASPIRFFQIAETDDNRASLSKVDLRYHNYPFKLAFKGAYSAIPRGLLIARLFYWVWKSDATLILLPGFHRAEFWAMLVASVLTGKRRGVFCDSTIHDQPNTLIKGILKRIFFSLCHGFFCYGERSRAYLIRHGATPSRIFLRCQAAALPANYSAKSALERRLASAPSAAAPRFLYVGRLSQEKSLDVLLKAFAKVRMGIPDATLVLVGAGPQDDELQVLAAKLGLVEAVLFAGSMDSAALAMEYARASCFVLPSISEPWGLVVNEALSFGCPTVVSDRCGCVPELVEGKSTGLVFEAGNIDDLTEKLLAAPVAFADVDATARECLALIGRFNPDAAAEGILAGCQKMLAECR